MPICDRCDRDTATHRIEHYSEITGRLVDIFYLCDNCFKEFLDFMKVR